MEDDPPAIRNTRVDTRALANFLLKIAYNRAHSFGEMNGKKFTISLKIIPKLAYTSCVDFFTNGFFTIVVRFQYVSKQM